jgi:Flp pilus assembly secretin CpaC
MMGGLITERDTKNKSGLPFLVRIPVVKHLFGNTSKSKERRELMIFVQPHILEDGVDHLNTQSELTEGSESYPANLQFAAPAISVPVQTSPPPAGRGVQSPILPLPAWQAGTAVSTDAPPVALPVDEPPSAAQQAKAAQRARTTRK